MAAPKQELKSNTYLSLDEVKEHLNIPQDETKWDNRVIRLINMVTGLVEKYIDGPAMTRELVDIKDGDAANTVVPDHWPVRQILEVRINYNGEFEENDPNSVTIIDAKQYTIRGTSDLEIGIRGTDVVLRNDGNLSIIGRLFIGSVVASIRLKYRAGWGDTPADMPEDLKYATLLAIEYFYLLRENRELNIKSKATFQGQSYTRDTGLPEEVEMLLDPYKDTSLGRNNRPQKNTFSI